MFRLIERISDKLLGRVVPTSTARAETCTRGPAYCVAPSSACSCRACQMQCFNCPGGQVCNMTGACC